MLRHLKAYSENRSFAWAALFLAAAVLLTALFFLDLGRRWWVDDDPMMIYAVRTAGNPLKFFIDPAFLRNLGAGNALAPLQALSLRVDAQWSRSPAAFYLHNILAVAASAVLVFACIQRLTRSLFLSLALSTVWIFLPSTLVVLQFISARHYIEGGAFTLLALLFLMNGEKKSFMAAALIAGSLAMLTKEIYAVLAVTLFVLWGLYHRRLVFTGSTLVLAGFYVVYRFQMLGASLAYQNPFPTVKEYWYFLGTLPFTITSNRGGYILLASAFFTLGWVISGERWGKTAKATISCTAISCPMILALYPVAYPVLLTYVFPTTLYRLHFALNTIFVLWLGVLLSAAIPRVLKMIVMLMFVAITLHGALKTRRWWLDRTDALRIEGEFFLTEGDRKLLYTEDAAHWFLPGLTLLYGLENRPFLNPLSPIFEAHRRSLETYGSVYRRIGKKIVRDDELYRRSEDSTGASSP